LTPTLAVRSSNSGSPGQGRAGKIERLPDHHPFPARTFSGGTRAFFVYGFAKSQRANIDDDEEEQFKEAAKHVLALTEKQLAELLKRGDFMEVKSE
jgi:RelE toxin of RelE / RelB toxin-antitoxin system